MTFFFFAGIALALSDWIAVAREARPIRWLTKPGALLALLLWFSTSTPVASEGRSLWFTLALCLSLIGDVFLLMEGHQFVKGGLAFGMAHVAFILAYHASSGFHAVLLGVWILLLIPTYALFREISGAIRRGGDPDLAWGVWIYAFLLTGMVSTALTTLFRPEWQPVPAWLTALGAALFYSSDVLLFRNRFLRPSPRAALMVIISYHLAQFSLTYAFVWYLLTTS